VVMPTIDLMVNERDYPRGALTDDVAAGPRQYGGSRGLKSDAWFPWQQEALRKGAEVLNNYGPTSTALYLGDG